MKKEIILNKIKENNKWIMIISFAVITIVSIIIRILEIEFLTNDMRGFLLRWFYNLKDAGGILGIGSDISNYNAPYIMILAILTYIPVNPVISIKIVSIIFDYILAISCVKLTKEILNEKYKKYIGLLVYGAILLLPTVILNSSFWGQCDSIYVSFIIISLRYLIKANYFKSFVFLGISFAFKLQFIFVLPVYILYFLSKRKLKNIYYFLILPITNFILCLPTVIFGKSIWSCISVYVSQAGEYSKFVSMNFPGVYNIFCDPTNKLNEILTTYEYLPKIMIIITGLIFLGVAIYVIARKVNFDSKLIIDGALWSIMISTFLLPYMHDRYMYTADIISVIYFAVNGKKKIYVPIIVNLCSLYTYVVYLSRGEINIISIKYIAIINFILIILLNINFLINLKKQQREKIE